MVTAALLTTALSMLAPGDGLDVVDRRVLTYADLRSVYPADSAWAWRGDDRPANTGRRTFWPSNLTIVAWPALIDRRVNGPTRAPSPATIGLSPPVAAKIALLPAGLTTTPARRDASSGGAVPDLGDAPVPAASGSG